MKRSKKLAPVAVLGAIALALTACSSSTTTTTTTASGPAASGLAGRGPITYVQGKDNSNVVKPLVASLERGTSDREGDLQGTDRPGRPAAR